MAFVFSLIKHRYRPTNRYICRACSLALSEPTVPVGKAKAPEQNKGHPENNSRAKQKNVPFNRVHHHHLHLFSLAPATTPAKKKRAKSLRYPNLRHTSRHHKPRKPALFQPHACTTFSRTPPSKPSRHYATPPARLARLGTTHPLVHVTGQPREPAITANQTSQNMRGGQTPAGCTSTFGRCASAINN